jgi:hypothetical protein
MVAMSDGKIPKKETTPTYSLLRTVRRRSRRHDVSLPLSRLLGNPDDTSRRPVCFERRLGADVSRR